MPDGIDQQRRAAGGVSATTRELVRFCEQPKWKSDYTWRAVEASKLLFDGTANMKTVLQQLTMLLMTVALCACAAIDGGPDRPRSTSTALADQTHLVEPGSLTAYLAIEDEDKRRLRRNEIIDERMLEIDTQYARYEENVWSSRTVANIIVDWFLIAIRAATATFGDEQVKARLGASAAVLQGGRDSFEKNAFWGSTLATLFAQMSAERKKVEARIGLGKRSSTSDYTIFAAVSDLEDYIHAGTIRGALEAAIRDAGVKEQEATESISELRSGSYLKDDAGDRLRVFWKPDGSTIDRTNETRLKEIMKRSGLDTGPGAITMFLRSRELGELRVKVARELRLL